MFEDPKYSVDGRHLKDNSLSSTQLRRIRIPSKPALRPTLKLNLRSIICRPNFYKPQNRFCSTKKRISSDLSKFPSINVKSCFINLITHKNSHWLFWVNEEFRLMRIEMTKIGSWQGKYTFLSYSQHLKYPRASCIDVTPFRKQKKKKMKDFNVNRSQDYQTRNDLTMCKDQFIS